MSESVSSRTKTVSDGDRSDSLEEPFIADRWSNNISYRQLVVSSCIGILQLWWHPYIHDLRKLVPFIFLYNVFSIIIGYPMFYLELALGVVTQKGVLRCWDLAPSARGLGFAMLFCSVLTALALGGVAAWCLAMVVHSFHVFLPWLHCAAAAAPACAARHRPLARGSETPSQSFFFNFVLYLKRDGLEGGLGNVVWELAIYYVICWLLVYFIAVKKIYSYSKLVLFKDVTAYFVLLCFALGAVRLGGAGALLRRSEWAVSLNDVHIWREAIEYSLLEMSVSSGVLVMLGVYCPKQHKLGGTALLALAASKTSTIAGALVLGATHGALQMDYDSNNTEIWKGSSASLVLWSDFVARVPGSQFWSALLFFTLFVLALSSTALLVQTMMSTLTGHSLRKVTWVFLIMACFLFCVIGVMTLCTQGGLYVINFLMEWPVSKARLFIAATTGIVVTYVYGQAAFCEDVYSAIGEYPGLFMRVCWATTPVLMLCMFLSGINTKSSEAAAGWVLVSVIILPVLLLILFYAVFKCRVRNIVGNEK